MSKRTQLSIIICINQLLPHITLSYPVSFLTFLTLHYKDWVEWGGLNECRSLGWLENIGLTSRGIKVLVALFMLSRFIGNYLDLFDAFFSSCTEVSI